MTATSFFLYIFLGIVVCFSYFHISNLALDFFSKKNIKKFDVVIGMYHDQVLTPMKTLFNFDAINLTIGLPFFRVSPDHGPNESMVGKNKSDFLSLLRCIEFLKN